jgi:hypothetical protein
MSTTRCYRGGRRCAGKYPIPIEEAGNSALLFDGIDDHVMVIDSADISFRNGVYVEAKIKPATI